MPRAPWYRGERGEWYVVVQFIIFVLIAVGPRALPGSSPWPEPAATVAMWLGYVFLFAGGALAVAGAVRLGPNLTALPYPKDCDHLIQTGPYAIVRHPIYSGLILGGFGWALWVHGTLTIVWTLALFVLFDAKTRLEERWLSEKFPEYAEYRTRVKKLVPWLY
jgi:protein-S-isoprenylcysteine O-methyltransferase Ste14